MTVQPQLIASPLPQPSPTRGGGSNIGGSWKYFPDTVEFARRKIQITPSFPPPWWGRVRVGGACRWYRILPVTCEKLSRMRNKSCGPGYATGRSRDTDSGVSIPCVAMLSTSSAYPKNSLSKSMAASTRNRSTRTKNAHGLLKKTGFASSASGTTRCCKIRTEWSQSFEMPSLRKFSASNLYHPPTPPLPHEGGGSGFLVADLLEPHA